MNESHDKRIMSLVHQCADMDPADRSAFLRKECRGDHALRSQVESLLAESGLKTGVHPSTQRRAQALPEHYRLIELIGAGGMAEVFLAEDTRLHRKVAIKFLNDSLDTDPERMRRFVQEARSASALNHPNIITIHDIGESDGVQFIVSEYVDGETLAARMTRGRLSIPEAIDIAIRTASALDSSHRAGIVHRDLKPENIMLRSDGGLKVVDFGLAKGSGIFEGSGNGSGIVMTSPGLILGTPRYMSPEQARGLPLDGRSDVFSLGIILFEMVTGRTPFPGGTIADTLAAILRHEPRSIAEFVKDPPQKLVHIVEKALRKDTEARYRSMASLLADLEDLRLDLTMPGRTAEHSAVVKQSGPGKVAIAVSLILLTVLATGAWWYLSERRSAPTTAGAMRNVPVTSWSTVSAEAVTAATFSPDGRMVAFGSSRSGASEIWTKPTAGGDPIQVTKNGFYNQYPVWSPDGQEIAYVSKRGDNIGIWKVVFTGGQETQLATGLLSRARPLRWMKDGRLLFQDGVDASEIYALDLTSGSREKLTDMAAAGITPRAFAVSADGTEFGVSFKENGLWKIRSIGFRGGTPREVASSKDQIDSLAFHPNGRDIYYTGSVDSTFQVFLASPDQQPIQISNSNSDLTLQDVSPDGTKILYNTLNETSDLWSLNVTDGKDAVLANDIPEEYWPDVSPDGRFVAYQSVAQADRPYRAAVMVKSIGSGDPVRVSEEGFSPVWSNDGQWIAYMRRTGTNISIWKVRPSGVDAMKLVEGPIMPPPYFSVPYLKTITRQMSWTPDGAGVVYPAKADGIVNLYVVPADGGPERPLTANGSADVTYSGLAWKADGRMLAFVSDAGQSHRVLAGVSGADAQPIFESPEPISLLGWSSDQVFVARRADPKDKSATPPSTEIISVSPSGTVRKIGEIANAYFANIHLSPNGQTIAYAARVNGLCEMWTLNSAGGAPRKLLTENDPKLLFSTIAWSSDGRTIVFGKQTRTNILSMLTN